MKCFIGDGDEVRRQIRISLKLRRGHCIGKQQLPVLRSAFVANTFATLHDTKQPIPFV